MAKKPLTEEEIIQLREKKLKAYLDTPVFKNIAESGSRYINMQPQNTAAIIEILQNKPKLIPGGILNNTPVNQGGLISIANAESEVPVVTPIQPTNTKLTGLETLLGNVIMPQILQPSNKQLIDAAILRGSLELLKPRQQGENFASQASRALTAAGQPAKTLADWRLKNAQIQASGLTDFNQSVVLLSNQFEKDIGSIEGEVGILGDFRTTAGATVRNMITDEANKYILSMGSPAALTRQKELVREIPNIKADTIGSKTTYTYGGDDSTIIKIVEELNTLKPRGDIK